MTNNHRKVLIGLGSNKSWHHQMPTEVIRSAAKALSILGDQSQLSPLYSSPAWPDPRQPSYVNAVLSLQSTQEPEALLAALLAVEAGYGRTRSTDPELRYAPRTLDCDLLAVGEERRATQSLLLPHPRLGERDFVLMPLRDVASDWRHPETGQDVDQMIASLPSITAQPH